MAAWFGGVVESLKQGDIQGVVNQAAGSLEQLATGIKDAAAEVRQEANFIRMQKTVEGEVTNLPWECDDESKSIVVDDLMEKILALSLDEANFNTEPSPSTEFTFATDRHVQVIMRLLELDPNLAKMHYRLSSKMDEDEFWRNYFHRCAILRAEVGLDSMLPHKPTSSSEGARGGNRSSTAAEDDAALEAEVSAELEDEFNFADMQEDLEALGEEFDAELEAEIAAELDASALEDGDGEASNREAGESDEEFDEDADLGFIDEQEIERELAEAEAEQEEKREAQEEQAGGSSPGGEKHETPEGDR